MSTAIIDERIVEMRFNNADFEKNVAQSMSTLEKLKQSLNFDSAKSLNELSKAGNSVNLNGISDAVETVNAKFSALQVIGMTALSELTRAAINTGATMVKSLISPITEGGMKRALNIEQAKFQLEGLGVAWENVKKDIDYAVDGTAYGLDVAARAASQLSASGVQVGDEMKSALRGISGVAAMTGRDYEDISRIFTTVAGNGRVMASELNRIGERGLNAKAALASFFNDVNSGSVTASDKVTAAIKSMTKGLNVTESDISDFVKKGLVDFDIFASAMDSAFGEHAKDANKTFTGALANMKAALSRIGAEFATPYMESMKNIFNSARMVFNGIKADLAPVVKDYEYFLKIIENGITSILDSKSFNNGIANIIDALRQSFWNLLLVLDPIRQAFVEIFPIDLLSNFENFTKKIADVVKKLEISNKDAANLRDTFKGIFSIFKTVGTVVVSVLQALVTALFPATQTMGGFLTTVLSVTGAIGRFITYISDVILKSEILQTIIKGIGDVLATVIKIASVPILLVLNGIVQLINYVDKLIIAFKKYAEETQLLSRISETFYTVLNSIIEVLKIVGGALLTGLIVGIYSLITGIGKLINYVKNLITNSETLQNIFKFLYDKIMDVKEGIKGLLEYLKQLANNSPAIQAIFDNLSKINKEGTEATTFLEKVGAVVKTVGTVIAGAILLIIDALGKAYDAVKRFVLKVIEEFQSLGGKSSSILQTISRIFESISNTIGNFIKKSGITDFLKKFKSDNQDSISFFEKLKTVVHDFFNEFTIGHAIALAFVGIMTAVGLSFIDLSKKIGGAMSNIGGLFGDIRNKLFGQKKNSMIDNFRELAISIALVAGSLALLASVDQNSLRNAFGLITNLIVGLTVLTAIMTGISVVLQKFKLTTNMTSFAKSILLMSVAVGIMAVALAALAEVDLGDEEGVQSMILKLKMILQSMIGLAAIVAIAARVSPGIAKGGIGIVAAALAIGLIIDAIKELKELTAEDSKKISDALNAMITIFVAITAMEASAGLTKFNASGGLGILLACMGLNKLLPVIVETMKALSEANLSGLKAKIENNAMMIGAGMAMLTVILFAFGKAAEAFKSISKILLSAAALSLSISISVAILSGVFKDLTEFFEDANRDADAWKKAAGAMTIMVGVLGLFTILFAMFAKLNIEKAVPKLLGLSVFLIAFSASLVILTQVMKQLVDLSGGDIAKGIVTIGFLAAIISAMVSICGKADKVNTKSLVALMLSITVLMGELIVLSVIPFEKLLAAMTAMAGVMWGLSKVIESVSDIKMTKDLIAQILILAEVTAAMILVGKTLSELAQFEWESIAAAGGAILAGMLGIKLVLDSLDGLKVDPSALAALAIASIDILAIGASLYLVSQQDWESIAAAGGAMLVSMIGLRLILDSVSQIRVNKNTLKALAIIAVDLIAIGASLYLVSQQPWESVAAAGGAMFAAMTSIGVVIRLISDLRINKSALIAMAVAIGDIVAIGVALYLVAQQPWESIVAAGGMLTLALLAVSGAIAIIGTIGGMEAIAAAGAILAVSASLVVLAAALKMFESINPEALKQAGIAFGVMVGVITILAAISSFTGGVFAAALMAVSVAMLAVGVAAIAFGAGLTLAATGMNLMMAPLMLMQTLDLNAIASGLVQLAIGLGAVSGAGAMVAVGAIGMSAAAIGIAALGVALKVANPSLAEFEKMNFSTVAKTSADLAVAGLALIPAAVGFSAAGAALVIFSGGLTTASGALMLFNAAIAGFLSVMNAAGPTTKNAATNIVNGITKPFSDMVTKVKKFIEDFKKALTLGWSSAEKDASSGGNKIAKALLKPFHSVLGWNSPPKFLVDLFNDMSKAITSGGTKAEGNAGSAGTGIANSLKSAITGGLSGFSIDGILANMFNGLNLQIDLSALGVSKYTSIKQKYKTTTDAATKAAKEDARAEKDFEKAAKEATTAVDSESQALESLSISAGKAGGSVKETAKDFTESLTETISGQLDMFKQFELKTEVTAEQMLANMKSNLDGFATWSAELAGLAERGIDQSLYQKLAEMGPNCYETVHAFSMMTDEQLQQANDMWQQSITLPESTAKIVGDGYGLAGQNAVKGLTNALSGGVSQVQGEGAKVGQAAVDGVMGPDGLAEKSPSKKTYQAGKYAIEGLNEGMKGMTAFVRGTASAIAKFIVSDFNTNMAPSFFINIGKNAIAGLNTGMDSMKETVYETAKTIGSTTVQNLIDGINSMTNDLYKATYDLGDNAMAGLEQGIEDHQSGPLDKAKQIAEKITKTIASALKVESPSKVMMKIGGYVAEGLAIGMDDGAERVYSSAGRLAEVTEEGVESMNGRIQDFLSDNLDFNPVITPKLDLSYMKEQLNSINSMFGERSLAASYAGQNGGVSSGTSAQINFTQNNYSPKALGRYEIYRNTRNQISQLKGALA